MSTQQQWLTKHGVKFVITTYLRNKHGINNSFCLLFSEVCVALLALYSCILKLKNDYLPN